MIRDVVGALKNHVNFHNWINVLLILTQDFSDLPINDENPDSVVVGLVPSKFNHETLSAAFNVIKQRKAPLIAINKSRYFASKDGLKLGTGKKVSKLDSCIKWQKI